MSPQGLKLASSKTLASNTYKESWRIQFLAEGRVRELQLKRSYSSCGLPWIRIRNLSRWMPPFSLSSTCIGGLITHLAECLGHGLSIHDNCPPVQGSMSLDLETCITMKMFCRDGPRIRVLNRHGSTIFLPNPLATAVRNQENWRYPSDSRAFHPVGADEVMQDTDVPAPEEASTRRTTSRARSADDFQEWRNRVDEELFRQGRMVDGLNDTVSGLNDMVTAMYNYHISQGHFPPPPPQ